MNIEQKTNVLAQLLEWPVVISMLQSADKYAIQERQVLNRMTPHCAPTIEGSDAANYHTFVRRCHVISEVYDLAMDYVERGEQPFFDFAQCSEEMEQHILNILGGGPFTDDEFHEDVGIDDGIDLEQARKALGRGYEEDNDEE